MFKKSLSILSVAMLVVTIASTAQAASTQGKSSMESNRSSAKENKNNKQIDGGKPTSTGARVAKSLDRNSVGKQRQSTKDKVNKLLDKQ